MICVHSKELTVAQCPSLSDTPARLVSLDVSHFQHLMHLLDQIQVCPGHPDEHFVKMTRAKKGQLISSSGDIAAYIDSSAHVELNGHNYSPTVTSSKCHILTPAMKCLECVSYRDTIRSIHHRWQKRPPSKLISTHNHVNERQLTTPERKEKTANVKHE